MRKVISFLAIMSFLLLGLISCGETEMVNEPTKNPTVEVPTENEKTPTVEVPTENEKTPTAEVPTEEENQDNEIQKYISAALAKLDEIVNPVINKISNEDLKKSVQDFYNNEKQYINNITDIDAAKAAASKVVEDTREFLKNTLKPLAIEKIDSIISPLIDKISHSELKASVQGFYSQELVKLSNVESLDDLVTLFTEIKEDTEEFIKSETEKIVIALKNKALEELNPYVLALIEKIPYDEVKTDVEEFYTEELKKLEAVNSIEGVNPCIEEIKEDLVEFALNESKKIAIAKLEEVVNAGLGKIPNPDIKEDLEEFAELEFAKIYAVEQLEDVVPTLTTVLEETQEHIKDLVVETAREYVRRLTQVETRTAYDYLPAPMSPMYENNLVTASDINYDFTSFISISDINQFGYGSQWQMVVENINQSIAIAKVFNVAQTILSAAGNAVDIYITNSYAEEISKTFTGENYIIEFEYTSKKIVFNVDITSYVNVPICGQVKPVIKMEYDLEKDAKAIFICLGDSYKAKYLISENTYELTSNYGITVAGKEVSRASYLSISKTNDRTVGHIYEYTTLDGSDKIKASADFYVENGYVSVVGNKASGMIGFDGYVNEVYSAESGKLLGYEVKEELTFAGITGTYNTIWFNIWDIQGINTIKVTDKTSDNKSSKSVCDVYLNGSTKMLVPTYNSKVVKTSRKYDVELRSRYYYSYDSNNNEYIAHEVLIPMMFIQEGENFESFTDDVYKDNNINLSVSLSQNHLNKILNDYDTLIDIFVVNKELVSSEVIASYLKQYE